MTVEARPLGSAGGVRPPDGPSAGALGPVLVLVLVLRWAEAPTSVPVPVPELGQSPASLPSPSSSPLLSSSHHGHGPPRCLCHSGGRRRPLVRVKDETRRLLSRGPQRSYCYIATSGAGGVEASRAPATSLSLRSRAVLGGRSEKLRPPEHTTQPRQRRRTRLPLHPLHCCY